MRDFDSPFSFLLRTALRGLHVLSGQEIHTAQRSQFIRTECCDAPIYHAERVLLRLGTTLRCAQCRIAIGEHADGFLTDMSWITKP